MAKLPIGWACAALPASSQAAPAASTRPSRREGSALGRKFHIAACSASTLVARFRFRRPRAEFLESGRRLGGENGTEIRIQAERLVEIFLGTGPVAELGVNHARVEEEARLRRVAAQRLEDRPLGLLEAVVLV